MPTEFESNTDGYFELRMGNVEIGEVLFKRVLAMTSRITESFSLEDCFVQSIAKFYPIQSFETERLP